jgi:hypothetical protein
LLRKRKAATTISTPGGEDHEAPMPQGRNDRLIYALPPGAIYYTFKRYMVGGLTEGAVKS